MSDSYWFYVDGSDLGLVTTSDSSDSVYQSNNTSATLKLYGKYEQPELTSDSSSPTLLNTRYHQAIVYRVLEELDPERYQYWAGKYHERVRQIRAQKNPLNAKRRIRQWHF